VEIGEEFVVFGLGCWGIRIWWFLVWVDESYFWVVGYVWDDVWKCFGEEIWLIGRVLREIWRLEGCWLWRSREKFGWGKMLVS